MSDKIVTRIFDLIPDNDDEEVVVETVKRCHVDENGRCRRIIGGRDRGIGPKRGFQEAIIECLAREIL